MTLIEIFTQELFKKHPNFPKEIITQVLRDTCPSNVDPDMEVTEEGEIFRLRSLARSVLKEINDKEHSNIRH